MPATGTENAFRAIKKVLTKLGRLPPGEPSTGSRTIAALETSRAWKQTMIEVAKNLLEEDVDGTARKILVTNLEKYDASIGSVTTQVDMNGGF